MDNKSVDFKVNLIPLKAFFEPLNHYRWQKLSYNDE